ncbi:MAG: cell division protein ZapA [Bradymonadales bacterium]|nr:cell division protein ZapA [Bradymonadales bacterium]
MSKKQQVAIRIAGQTLYLLTEEEPQHVYDVANYLSTCLEEIRQGSGSASTYQVALLAGMRVVEELFVLRRDLGQYQNRVEDKVERMLSLLNEHERATTSG